MDRDPTEFEVTRDPIFLFMIGTEQWIELPDGIETDGEAYYATDEGVVEDWVKELMVDGVIEDNKAFFKAAKEHETDSNWPLLTPHWRVELVFLTRDEAEDWGEAHDYRFEMWKVFCMPCHGELAKILNEYEAKPSTLFPWKKLNGRARNALNRMWRRSGWPTCEQLMKIGSKEYRDTRNVGDKTVLEVNDLMIECGFHNWLDT